MGRLDGSLVPDYCATSESIVSNECPSSEWQSLAAFEVITSNSIPFPEEMTYNTETLPDYTQLTGRSSIRQFTMGFPLDSRPGAIPYARVSTTQQSVIADALTNTAALWDIALINATSGSTHGSPLLNQRAATHVIKSSYYQPYTIASCSGKMYLNMTEGSPIKFPVSSAQRGKVTGNTTVPVGNTSKLHATGNEYYGMAPTQILDSPRSSYLDFRLKWVNLPNNPFNGTALGAIVLLPRESANSSQFLYTCTISAGWGNSSLSTSTGYSVEPVSSQAYNPMKAQNDVVPGTYANSHASEYQLYLGQKDGIFDEPYYPEKRLNITPDWADYLNPFLPGLNTTVFNTLMSLDTYPRAPFFRASDVLIGLMTNGLARVGFRNTLQGSLKTFRNPKTNNTDLDGNYWTSGKGDVFAVDPIESKEWAKFLVESSLQGYAYNTSGAARKVAIVFLLTYCVFALSHVLYAGFSGTLLPLFPNHSPWCSSCPSNYCLLNPRQASVPHPGTPSPKSPLSR